MSFFECVVISLEVIPATTWVETVSPYKQQEAFHRSTCCIILSCCSTPGSVYVTPPRQVAVHTWVPLTLMTSVFLAPQLEQVPVNRVTLILRFTGFTLALIFAICTLLLTPDFHIL